MLAFKTQWAIQSLSEEKVQRFQQTYLAIEEVSSGYGIEIKPGQIFNSGYEGFTFFVGKVKCIVIEQSGKVGLEDQSNGYIDLRVGSKQKRITTHRDRGFGDVSLSKSELEKAYNGIWEDVMDLLIQ